MKKRDHDAPKLVIEVSESPSLTGNKKVKKTKYSKGTVHFSELIFPIDYIETDKKIPEHEIAKLSLDSQSYSELASDRGLFLSTEILFSEGFGKLGKHTIASMSAEIATSVGDSSWEKIEEHLLSLDEESGHREVFLQAAWAQIFSDPFEELWLAAMALHACFVLEDDFAFGYLIAQIDQKRDNETHFLRGKKTIESARAGGKENSRNVRERTNLILVEMARLQKRGHTVTRSATLAHNNDFGTSAGANRKLWARYSKK